MNNNNNNGELKQLSIQGSPSIKGLTSLLSCIVHTHFPSPRNIICLLSRNSRPRVQFLAEWLYVFQALHFYYPFNGQILQLHRRGITLHLLRLTTLSALIMPNLLTLKQRWNISHFEIIINVFLLPFNGSTAIIFFLILLVRGPSLDVRIWRLDRL